MTLVTYVYIIIISGGGFGSKAKNEVLDIKVS